jgi:hypothetical protein
MSFRLLSASGGRRTSVKFEPDGTFLIKTEQEVDDILDHNRILRNHDDKGWTSPAKDMRRVASIPMNVVYQWLQEGIDVFSGEQQDEVAKRLNDPDWAYLRTAPGHLGPVGDGTYR